MPLLHKIKAEIVYHSVELRTFLGKSSFDIATIERELAPVTEALTDLAEKILPDLNEVTKFTISQPNLVYTRWGFMVTLRIPSDGGISRDQITDVSKALIKHNL